jgi:hypothetical protein
MPAAAETFAGATNPASAAPTARPSRKLLEVHEAGVPILRDAIP